MFGAETATSPHQRAAQTRFANDVQGHKNQIASQSGVSSGVVDYRPGTGKPGGQVKPPSRQISQVAGPRNVGQIAAGGTPRSPQPVGEFGAFLKGLAAQESGGDYGAVGIPTKSGTAYGKYQILDSNIEGPGGWDQEALGREIDIEEFAQSPALQEAIARSKLKSYFNRYGAAGAAKAWYAGEGNANSMSDSPQYGGPSIVDYANDVLANMARYQ